MEITLLNSLSKSIKHKQTFNISIHLIFYFLIAIVISIGYWPAIDNQFVHWDDQYYITDNIYIYQPTWEHFKMLLTKVISLNYHPITMLSLWANSYFSGVTSAAPYIITNIVIHGFTALLIYHFVLLLFEDKYIMAAITAIIFAIHPMHVESVAWVSERKDVLYTFFFFASLNSWLLFQDKRKLFWYVAATILFVLACLSKAMAVSLVAILFLIDIYKNKNIWRPKSILQKTPFIAIGIFIGLIAIDVQSGGNFYGLLSNTNIETAVNLESQFSIFYQLTNAGYGLFFYITSFILPTTMSAFHPYSSVLSHPLYDIFIVIPILILLIWLASQWLNKTVFLGLGIFLSTLVLVLQLIPVGAAIVADRYTYIPYVGLAMLIGALIQYIYNHKSKILAIGMLPCITLPLLLMTIEQSDVWQNHTTLFTQAVTKYPEDSKSRILLATGQWTSGNHTEAIENIEYAINELGLHTSDAFEQLANCYDEIGERQKAIAFYNHSIELNPQNHIARYHRGICIMETNPKQAIEDFNIAESSGFEYVLRNIYGPRGVCYGMIGEYDKAISDLSKAIELGQDLKINYRDRATTYEMMGEISKAQRDWDIYNNIK